MSPRPCLAMKLMASGVAICAGMTRSPSFSRSSASTSTTMRPLLHFLDDLVDRRQDACRSARFAACVEPDIRMRNSMSRAT